MNIDLEIVRDGKPVTVTVDVQSKSWLGGRCGYESDPTVFAAQDSLGCFPIRLTTDEAQKAEDAAQAIWEANEGAQAAEEHRIEAQTLAYEARRDRDEERLGESNL